MARATSLTTSALVALLLSMSSGASADTLPSPNICPHTSNRYLYYDNATAYDVKAKKFLRASLIAAAQLKVGDKTQGFVFLDDLGNAWVTVSADADARTRSWFRGLRPPNLMLLAAFARTPNQPLPVWAHLEKCPAA